ncbi:MAG: hypothetical protein MUO43_14180 [Desulfobacterales bacterium]|nr:hypothetical protein [Desulfobacterales bacterium]
MQDEAETGNRQLLMIHLKIRFRDIEDAFFFASGSLYENHAILCKQSGEIYYISEMKDSDELPYDVDDPGKYIEIPNPPEQYPNYDDYEKDEY